jgi:hypothetical protein
MSLTKKRLRMLRTRIEFLRVEVQAHAVDVQDSECGARKAAVLVR